MAFGSLMQDGHDVRISGQDVGRGTFSQRFVYLFWFLAHFFMKNLIRHAMLVDQNSEKLVVPLNHNLQSEGRFELANSSLSEFAVLGVSSFS